LINFATIADGAPLYCMLETYENHPDYMAVIE